MREHQDPNGLGHEAALGAPAALVPVLRLPSRLPTSHPQGDFFHAILMIAIILYMYFRHNFVWITTRVLLIFSSSFLLLLFHSDVLDTEPGVPLYMYLLFFFIYVT